jgi:hypothetical protein
MMRINRTSAVPAALALLCLFSATALANTTSLWTQAGVAHFYKGKYSGTALTADGYVVLGDKTDTVFTTTEPFLWALAYDSRGDLWAGSGNKAILYRIRPDGKYDEVAILPGVGVSAIAVDGKNNVYAALFPGAEIYRLRPGGKAEPFAKLPATFVWDMKFGPSGALYCVTGAGAGAYKITGDGKNVTMLYTSSERHFLSMFLDGDKYLYTGSSPNGLVLRIDIAAAEKGSAVPPAGPAETGAPGGAELDLGADTLAGAESLTPPESTPEPAPDKRATVLVDLDEDEAYRLLPWDDGWFLVAANQDQTMPAQAAQQQPGRRPAGIEPLSFPLPPKNTMPGKPFKPARMYLVNAAGQTRKVLEIPDPYILSLQPLGGGSVLIGTGDNGRIYNMNVAEDKVSLQELPAGQILAITGAGPTLRIATSSPAKIFTLSRQPIDKGTFTSSVNDASTPAVYGNLDAVAVIPEKSSVEFKTRTGNTPSPKDGTWSGWSDPQGRWPFKITSPPGRYIQYQAIVRPAPDGASPELREVRLYYLTANQPPELKTISVLPSSLPRRPTAPTAVVAMPAASGADAEDEDMPSAATQPVLPDRPPSVGGAPENNLIVGTITTSEQVTIRWIAADPDQDTLRYTLHFRKLPNDNWTLLKEKVYEQQYSWSVDSVPDGRYEVRVSVTDEDSNPEDRALTDEIISDPFIIDRTRPRIDIQELRAGEKKEDWTASGAVYDATSVVSGIEYSLDDLEWHEVFPVDGLLDSGEEQFKIRFKPTGPGPHTFLIRARDFVGNTGSEARTF